jgi:murein DD-endopeptidase MepM/ murein hydrolase activator NlpD
LGRVEVFSGISRYIKFRCDVYCFLKYCGDNPGIVRGMPPEMVCKEMAGLDKRFLTFIVLPSDSSKSKKIKVSRNFFRAGGVVFGVFLLICAYVVVDYGSMKLEVRDHHELRKENTSQKIELQTLSSRVNEVESRMAKLKIFDKKLRILANIEAPVKVVEQGHTGMGGPAPDSTYFLSVEAKKKALVEDMRSDITDLESETRLQERSFAELQEYLLSQSSILASTPSIMPARGWLTSTFGTRKDPFTGRRHKHRGIDLANRIGTPISAPADGIITRIVRLPQFGKMVEISHGYGTKTRYGHLSKIVVKVGQKIKRGEKIALMGNTGRSTGPHVHYEIVVNGVHVNPYKYIVN